MTSRADNLARRRSWDQRGTLWPEIETLPAYDRFRRRILDVTRAYVMVAAADAEHERGEGWARD